MFTYLTVCTSADYLGGVIALERSLRKVRSAYPLTVLVTPAVPPRVDRALQSLGIRTMRSTESLAVPDEIIDRNAALGAEHWSRTFDKLLAFTLVGFKKVVCLDSDMMVLRNIDELFERPHMSAVIAGKSQPGNEKWELLNSGCLVVVPREGELDRLWQAVPDALTTRSAIGDQDLLQVAHPRWVASTELHLDEGYNLFFPYLEHYMRTLGYSLSGSHPVKIVHFVGVPKPWSLTSREVAHRLVRHIRHRQWNSAIIFAEYQLLILSGRIRLRAAAHSFHPAVTRVRGVGWLRAPRRSSGSRRSE